MHSASLLSLRKDVLEEACRLVPKYGFNSSTLFSLAVTALKEGDAWRDRKDLDNVNFAQMFPRGFPIAVVEHIVQSTNRATHQRLEERFNKATIFASISRNGELYRGGHYKPPVIKNVVEEALLTKLYALTPYKTQWSEAVALEWNPTNVPFALKSAAEFVDTTCYYAERMENLGAVIASGNVLLQSRLHYPMDFKSGVGTKENWQCPRGTDEERFWRSFSSGIPLSSGPHMGQGLLSYDWYAKRAKVATTLGLVMLSFIGEEANHYRETKAMNLDSKQINKLLANLEKPNV